MPSERERDEARALEFFGCRIVDSDVGGVAGERWRHSEECDFFGVAPESKQPCCELAAILAEVRREEREACAVTAMVLARCTGNIDRCDKMTCIALSTAARAIRARGDA